MKLHDPIPKDHPVQPLRRGQEPAGKTTCGHCGLSWDDDKSTSMTPVPSARCPFEYFHRYPESEPTPGERLRSAAPELLDALQDAAASYQFRGIHGERVTEKIRAAIAKATGSK